MSKLFYSLVLLSAFMICQNTWAQDKKAKDQYLPKANKAFSEKKYTEAEKKYRLSDHKDVSGAKSSYNLGNAIYKQKYHAESVSNFQKSLSKAQTKAEKHRIYHNMGNAMMALKNYQGAVEAYKNALRNNPNDDQTRYNYALAKKLLEENPPPPDNNQDDNQDQNQQNQQNQDQDQQDNEDNQNQDNQDNQDQDQDQNESDKPSNPNKRNLEALLDAVENQEKKTQQKVNENKNKGSLIKQEKEW